MFGGKIRRALTIGMAVITLFSVGGVYATWKYAANERLTGREALSINAFTWAGAEMLPSESESGINHLSLVENLIKDLNLGRSSQAQSLINARVNNTRDEFGNMAMTGGGTLNNVIGAENMQVNFIIYFPDGVSKEEGDSYYVFTTSVQLGYRGGSYHNGSYLQNTKPGIHFFWDGTSDATKNRIFEIYRTEVVYDWTINGYKAATTDLGSALPCWYDENQPNAYKNNTQIPAFEPSTFRTIDQTPIATAENPACMYINYSAEYGYEGETVYVCPKNYVEEKWFYLAPEMASGVTSGTVTLTLQPACKACKLDVFSSTAGTDDTLIASNDGSGVVSFTATQGVTYYVRVSGAYSIVFDTAFTPS